MHAANDMVWAMTAMAAYGVGAFFIRFWRQTEDRLFALFGLAFALLGANWTILAVYNPREESRHLVYIIRLAAFLVFIAAIIDKNRGGRAKARADREAQARSEAAPEAAPEATPSPPASPSDNS